MNEDKFFQQLKALYGRVTALQQNTGDCTLQEEAWLPIALQELNTAFEELQVAEEELRAQNEALALSRQAVEAERQRYQELFEFAPDGYLVTDRNGKVQEANRAAAGLLNVSQQFLVGKLLISFLTQEARPVLRAALTQLDQGTQEQEWVVRLQPRRSPYIGNNPEDSLLQELGGVPFDANLKMVAVRDSAGKLVALRCLLSDITERKQMLETLIRARVVESMNQQLEKEISERKWAEAEREALLAQIDHKQRLLEAVLQQMPAGVTIAEAPSGQIVLANEESARILGHRFLPSEPKDRAKRGAFHPDGLPYDIEEYPQRRSRTFGEIVKDEEMYYVRRDGRQIILSVSATPVRDQAGKIVATVGTFYEITERKQAEAERAELLASEQEARQEAEVANRLKDEFLSVLSHEIRTPLNAMLGWASLLRSRKFDEPTTARALETIERNARTQTQLIDDLLDVSRIIRGKLALDICPIELVSVVEAAMETVHPAAEAKSIRLVSVLDSAASVVLADYNRLQQVAWNLLSNAVKFTPEEGRVEVYLEQANSHIQMRVKDTGIGIRAEFLPYVFDRFRQADSTVTRSHSGLGLGLAIARHLVELHGGTVQVESPGEGQGATFTVSLPLKVFRPEQDALKTESNLTHERQPHDYALVLDGLQVLVVDDEADTRELLTTILEQVGARVTAVASVADALEAIAADEARPLAVGSPTNADTENSSEAQRFDILLSDIGMPEEDGYTLIRKIRTRSPEQGGQIPAVALTAYAREEDRIRALSAGFQIHLSKPVNPTKLIAVVAGLAGRTEKV